MRPEREVDPVFGLAVGESRVAYCRGGEPASTFVDIYCGAGGSQTGWTWFIEFAQPVQIEGHIFADGFTQSSVVPGVVDRLRSWEVEWAPDAEAESRVLQALFRRVPTDYSVEPRGSGRVRSAHALTALVDVITAEAAAVPVDGSDAVDVEELLRDPAAGRVVDRISYGLWQYGYSLAIVPLRGGLAIGDPDPWREFR